MLNALRAEREQGKYVPRLSAFRRALEEAPELHTDYFRWDQPVVTIGRPEEITPGEREALLKSLKGFMPWKKGPFSIFGIDIDAEWRSDWKWDRILPQISSLEGKVVADIGCHNGYFMYRMLAQNPKQVIGFEPYARHWFNFMLLQKYAKRPELSFELLGVEHMGLFPRVFDTVFCLGILYHHTDPVSLLQQIHRSMKPGGELIVECQGIPGEDPVSLVPLSRYATSRCMWNLPTVACLKSWLHRTQFKSVQCFFAEPLSTQEQRRTEWAPVSSLKDFLDPNDSSRTVEGYPAPWRIYVKARRN